MIDLPDVGIAISLARCSKCKSGFAFVQTRKQAEVMAKSGVFNTLRKRLPDLVALWGGSGLKACPECGRLLPLPTPQQWADSLHSLSDFGLDAGVKTVVDSGMFASCSACGAPCTGEPGAFGYVRSVSLTIPVETGQTEAVCIRQNLDAQPVLYADIHPDHIELDFPVCGPDCAKAMQAELDKTDIDDILTLVGKALDDRESWERMTWR